VSRGIKVFAGGKEAGKYFYNIEKREHVFTYTKDNPISLVMPYKKEPYISQFKMIPIFDQFMPEGWLFEYLKNQLRKRIKDFVENDFTIFEFLAPNIKGFLNFKRGRKAKAKKELRLTLSEILENDTFDLFYELVNTYLFSSAISGLQPKVLVPLTNKSYAITDDYIVKTFGGEFPHLAENEYFCIKAVKKAGIPTAEFWLSSHKKFFITRRFTKRDLDENCPGFEEFCTLFGRTKDEKYAGSYESIAKALRKISANPEGDLEIYFKIVVMNYLLKNGDAHLKNVGVLYTSPYTGDVRLSPAYDVVSTVVYIPSDQPALTLFGKKVWFSKKELIDFGISSCLLDSKRAKILFEQCEHAVAEIRREIEVYMKEESKENQKFFKRFLKVLEFSLTKNLKYTYKNLSKEMLIDYEL
jgi:serine/threonine-protein kinase HipA